MSTDLGGSGKEVAHFGSIDHRIRSEICSTPQKRSRSRRHFLGVAYADDVQLYELVTPLLRHCFR